MGIVRQGIQRLILDLHAVFAGVGVKDDIHPSSLNHRVEMADDLGLRRLGVKGHGQQYGVISHRLGAQGVGNHTGGRGRVGACDQRLARFGEILHERQHRVAFGIRHQIVFARRPAGHPTRDAGGAEGFEMRFEGHKIDLTRGVEGGY